MSQTFYHAFELRTVALRKREEAQRLLAEADAYDAKADEIHPEENERRKRLYHVARDFLYAANGKYPP